MLDPLSADLIPLRDVPKLLPKHDGKRHHMNTIFRWASKGLRGVQLETVRIGGRLFTSAVAIQEFTARLSEPTSQRKLSAERDAQFQEVMRRLRMEGFCSPLTKKGSAN